MTSTGVKRCHVPIIPAPPEEDWQMPRSRPVESFPMGSGWVGYQPSEGWRKLGSKGSRDFHSWWSQSMLFSWVTFEIHRNSKLERLEWLQKRPGLASLVESDSHSWATYFASNLLNWPQSQVDCGCCCDRYMSSDLVMILPVKESNSRCPNQLQCNNPWYPSYSAENRLQNQQLLLSKWIPQ